MNLRKKSFISVIASSQELNLQGLVISWQGSKMVLEVFHIIQADNKIQHWFVFDIFSVFWLFRFVELKLLFSLSMVL